MCSNFNFNNTYQTDQTPAPDGAGRLPAADFPIMRQHSIYALTFDEFQSTVGGIGKDFGSMNMDELLKSIWNAEENQNIGPAAGAGAGAGGQEGGGYLNRQGSLTLPRTLSLKTVDEVWRDMSKEYDHGTKDGGRGGVPAYREPTLGEVTLEEFLVRAGAVREDPDQVGTSRINNPGLFGDLSRAGNDSGFGHQTTNGMVGLMGGRIVENSDTLPVNGNGGAKQATSGYGVSMGNTVGNKSSEPGIRNGIVGISNPITNSVVQNVTIENGGLRMVGVGSPAISTTEGLSRSNGDTSSVSPVPYVFNNGSLRGRKGAALEKVVERRQKRMIKNRESAARSRARKQAYTEELEAEVAQLKEENEELRKKQAEMIEMQKNQVMEMMKQQNGNKRRCLRRTQTGPW